MPTLFVNNAAEAGNFGVDQRAFVANDHEQDFKLSENEIIQTASRTELEVEKRAWKWF